MGAWDVVLVVAVALYCAWGDGLMPLWASLMLTGVAACYAAWRLR